MLQEDYVLPQASEQPFLLALHAKNDTTKRFGCKLGKQQKTTKLYFSFQIRKQFKILTVPFKPLCCCLRSAKVAHVIATFENSARSIFKLLCDLVRQSNRSLQWFPL